jgi:hypothetical protein
MNPGFTLHCTHASAFTCDSQREWEVQLYWQTLLLTQTGDQQTFTSDFIRAM